MEGWVIGLIVVAAVIVVLGIIFTYTYKRRHRGGGEMEDMLEQGAITSEEYTELMGNPPPQQTRAAIGNPLWQTESPGSAIGNPPWQTRAAIGNPPWQTRAAIGNPPWQTESPRWEQPESPGAEEGNKFLQNIYTVQADCQNFVLVYSKNTSDYYRVFNNRFKTFMVNEVTTDYLDQFHKCGSSVFDDTSYPTEHSSWGNLVRAHPAGNWEYTNDAYIYPLIDLMDYIMSLKPYDTMAVVQGHEMPRRNSIILYAIKGNNSRDGLMSRSRGEGEEGNIEVQNIQRAHDIAKRSIIDANTPIDQIVDTMRRQDELSTPYILYYDNHIKPEYNDPSLFSVNSPVLDELVWKYKDMYYRTYDIKLNYRQDSFIKTIFIKGFTLLYDKMQASGDKYWCLDLSLKVNAELKSWIITELIQICSLRRAINLSFQAFSRKLHKSLYVGTRCSQKPVDTAEPVCLYKINPDGDVLPYRNGSMWCNPNNNPNCINAENIIRLLLGEDFAKMWNQHPGSIFAPAIKGYETLGSAWLTNTVRFNNPMSVLEFINRIIKKSKQIIPRKRYYLVNVTAHIIACKLVDKLTSSGMKMSEQNQAKTEQWIQNSISSASISSQQMIVVPYQYDGETYRLELNLQ